VDGCKPLPEGALLLPRAAAAGGVRQPDADGAAPLLHGEVVQVDPIKPTLKLPGTKRLKLKYEMDCFQVLLSNSACAATTR
jgi:hypothetical protein